MENKLRNFRHLKNYERGEFEDSVSSLVLDFAADWIEECESKEMYFRVIPFVILCWNIGNAQDAQKREEGIQKIIDEMGTAFTESCRMLVNRKFDFYNEYKYLVVEYDITSPNDNLYLTVVSAKLN